MWRKLNLVTEPKGDQLKCSHCGHTLWCRSLKRPTRCPKCGCLEMEEHPAKDVVWGCWSDKNHSKECAHCKGPTIIVPRTGHPNSKFWMYERNDGLVLMACKKGCPEELPKKLSGPSGLIKIGG